MKSKSIDKIAEELKRWQREGQGTRAFVFVVAETDTDGRQKARTGMDGDGLQVLGALAILLCHAAKNGITPDVVMSAYEQMKGGIETDSKKEGKDTVNNR